jgi:hypothetical protein
MDNSTDKPKKSFICPECGEHLTTKQNLKRHCLRKHKETVWETVVESPPITLNETEAGGLPPTLIENDPLVSIMLDDRGFVSETQELQPIPGDDYLITLIQECEKYQHLFPAIKRQMKWNKNNSNVDINLCKHTFSVNMYRILTDIKDLYAKPIDE